MFWQNDKEFLKKLDLERNKTLYIKIVLLDFAENPIEEIQGRVSDGSLSLDGDSAIRRTCNLTLQVDKLNFDYSLWAVKSKFQLFIGLENNINDSYDYIIWFKQGVFVFTSFNPQLSTNGCSISISGKDKMCLLNGEMGGAIRDNSVDFSYIDEIDADGNRTQTKQLIKDIIYNGLVNYANELPYKIFLNDLDDKALEVVSYKGEKNVYLLKKKNENIIDQIVLEDDKFWEPEGFVYDDLIETDTEKTPSSITVAEEEYTVIKIEKNDIIGYRETDLTYTGELILNTGEAITSMLDKIKTMLGSYEYFYDVDGNFIFQKKKTYTDSKYSILKTDSVSGETYADAAINNTEIAYKFLDTSLITSLSNTPNLANLKNDFSIWGSRKGVSGAEIPIHLRYAFAKKPERYMDYQGEKEILATNYDWRELIYHMALDYYQYGQENNFLSTVAKNNPEYPLGITGYESFYLELNADWRKMYLGTDKGSGKFKDNEFDIDEESKTYLWHTSVIDDSSNLDYWLDFLDDSDWDSGQYNIHTIGNRTVAINNSEITNIILPEIPMVIFYESGKKVPNNTGYTLIQCPTSMWSAFEIAKVGYSAFEELNELLYKHTGFNDSVSLSILPIYYLQPNTLIEISNADINIFGKFIMNRISIPLKQGGTSSINAIKSKFRY